MWAPQNRFRPMPRRPTERQAECHSKEPTVFANNCQGCHGADASGGFGPKLAGNPILNADALFWETVLHGRGSMPAWEHALSRQDIADVHVWLKTK